MWGKVGKRALASEHRGSGRSVVRDGTECYLRKRWAALDHGALDAPRK
jgi:hypothetical protein